MLESGLVQRIVKKWSKTPSKPTDTIDNLILGLAQVRTPFAILLVGIGFALIVMLVEKIYCHRIHRGGTHLYKPNTWSSAGELDQEDVNYWKQRAMEEKQRADEAEKKLGSIMSTVPNVCK